MRYSIEGFSKYSFGLDGSVYHIRKGKFVNGTEYFKKDRNGKVYARYIRYGFIDDDKILKSLTLHQIVYKVHNPEYELFKGNNLVVDHINPDWTLENYNLINNLQLITNRKNCSKERVEKSGLPVGVKYDNRLKRKKRFQARIYVNGKDEYLGTYQTSDEASEAYKRRLSEL